MRGTMMIVKPDTLPAEFVELDRVPDIGELHDAVGGYIEVVPFFQSINFRGEIRSCVALCNEDGKREGLPFNQRATMMWGEGAHGDVLVGNVVILWGDRQFMEEL